MTMHAIRVSEAEDRKLWRLIVKNKWEGVCSDPYTYILRADQLHQIKSAGINFEEIKPQAARKPPARRISGARQR